MAARAETRSPVPLPTSDALFVNCLRAGLAAYERGDYRRAADVFQDAAAVGGARPEARMWAVLGAALELQLHDGALVSRDAALPAESTVSR